MKLNNKYLAVFAIIVIICISTAIFLLHRRLSGLAGRNGYLTRKAMDLEFKNIQLEKKIHVLSGEFSKLPNREVSQAYSLSYNSDMVNKHALSARYAELTDGELGSIKQKIPVKKSSPIKEKSINKEHMSPNENIVIKEKILSPKKKKSDLWEKILPGLEEINKVSDDSTIKVNLNDVNKVKIDQIHNIRDNHSDNPLNIKKLSRQRDFSDGELNHDVIRSLSEGLNYDGAYSDDISDIPVAI